MFDQMLVQANNKEIIKAPYFLLDFCVRIVGQQWIFRTKTTFMRNHRQLVDLARNMQVTRKAFPCHDVTYDIRQLAPLADIEGTSQSWVRSTFHLFL